MKKFLIIVSYLLFFVFISQIAAQEIESDTYKIEGFSVTGGGGFLESPVDGKYTVFSSIGESFADERLESASYGLDLGSKNTIQSNVPLINCFVAGVEDTSNCDDLDFVNGLEALCGDGGCFDRAHFEIDTQGNPTDVLYGIQIKKTTDAVWSYIDGLTNLVEDSSSRSIADYKTKNDWESIDFNILGLESGVTYQIRATALHGDFTESVPGPFLDSPTSNPSIFFDIDIAGDTWTASSAPYGIDFEEILPGYTKSANERIWLSIGTNALSGSSIQAKSVYGGFVQTEGSNYKISQISSSDLSLDSEGMGFRSMSQGQEYLGPLVSLSPFNGSGEFEVGAISSSSWSPIYNTTNQPILGGRSSLRIIIKPDNVAPAGMYTEEITFVAFGIF